MTLPGMVSGGAVIDQGSSLREIINALGLTSGLQLLLDWSDINSWPGSGQTWFDISGNGRHFNLGTTSGSEGSDPTSHGTPGGQSANEYAVYDGTDCFTKATANDTFFNSLHKDGAVWSLLMIGYADAVISSSAYQAAGDAFVAGRPGIVLGNTGANGRNMFFQITKDGVDQLNKSSTAEATNNSWNAFALSLDETTGALILAVNGTQESSSGNTFPSPSALDAGTAWQFAATGVSNNLEKSGNRTGCIAMWSRALTAAELTSLYTAMKGKFSLP